jgi:hypothetical protein
MAPLVQALIVLIVPFITSGAFARLSYTPMNARAGYVERGRIERMEINAVIYFDAPPAFAQQRIWR